MKVKELIKELQKADGEKEIHITNMSDFFCETEFSVKTIYDDENYVEIIMNNYNEIIEKGE